MHNLPSRANVLPLTTARYQAGIDEQVRYQTSLARLLEILEFEGLPGKHQGQQFDQKLIRAGKPVCSTVDANSALYAVQVGILKTEFFGPLGEGYAVCFPKKGDLIGCELLTPIEFVSKTTAVTDVNVIVIPTGTVQVLIRDCEAFSQGLYGILARYILASHKRLQSQTKLKAPAKIASFLIAELESSRFGSGENCVNLQMKLTDVASYLGITLETLSKILSEFELEGLISRCRKVIEIRNRSGLEERFNSEMAI